MNTKATVVSVLIAAAFAGFAAGVRADEAAMLTGEILTMDANGASKGQGVVTGKIVSDFQSFAGSKANATSLVTGLRNGSEITLVEKGQPAVTFTAPTRPMGFGNVSTSLALAKFQLAQQGITNPTPAQLQTALTGGSITANGKTVVYQGILQMRADGLGWGEIAHSVGTKLGPVVSGIKTQNQHLAPTPHVTPHRTTAIASAGNGTTSTASAARTRSDSSSSARGVVTASGGPPSAAGAPNGKGHGNVTTASGAPKGQGIVTAAGPSPVASSAGATTQTGVVTASGGGASASANGAGRGGGNGKALGHAK
jgi:hypothetical protein